MGRASYTTESFLEAWEDSDSIAEVADRLGISYVAARNFGMRLSRRPEGAGMRAMRKGPRGAEAREWKCLDLGIPEEEISELVQAFRSSRG